MWTSYGVAMNVRQGIEITHSKIQTQQLVGYQQGTQHFHGSLCPRSLAFRLKTGVGILMPKQLCSFAVTVSTSSDWALDGTLWLLASSWCATMRFSMMVNLTIVWNEEWKLLGLTFICGVPQLDSGHRAFVVLPVTNFISREGHSHMLAAKAVTLSCFWSGWFLSLSSPGNLWRMLLWNKHLVSCYLVPGQAWCSLNTSTDMACGCESIVLENYALQSNDSFTATLF